MEENNEIVQILSYILDDVKTHKITVSEGFNSLFGLFYETRDKNRNYDLAKAVGEVLNDGNLIIGEQIKNHLNSFKIKNEKLMNLKEDDFFIIKDDENGKGHLYDVTPEIFSVYVKSIQYNIKKLK